MLHRIIVDVLDQARDQVRAMLVILEFGQKSDRNDYFSRLNICLEGGTIEVTPGLYRRNRVPVDVQV